MVAKMVVRQKEFFMMLDHVNRLRFRMTRDDGEIVDFVVQYETLVEDDFRPVVRYDASHGRGHRDTLGPGGETVAKEWLPHSMSHKEALHYAADDLRMNWERYRDRFLERIG
jgi:hypothetical protein